MLSTSPGFISSQNKKKKKIRPGAKTGYHMNITVILLNKYCHLNSNINQTTWWKTQLPILCTVCKTVYTTIERSVLSFKITVKSLNDTKCRTFKHVNLEPSVLYDLCLRSYRHIGLHEKMCKICNLSLIRLYSFHLISLHNTIQQAMQVKRTSQNAANKSINYNGWRKH